VLALLEVRLAREEGRRQFPYVDSVGKLSIGVGHNLTDKGLPEAIIDALLVYDIAEAEADLDRDVPWWHELDDVRAAALADLCFNLGITALLTFKETLALIHAGDWPAVADHLRASLWYRQVGTIRGESIARAFETGTEVA
jgi:lysozyme